MTNPTNTSSSISDTRTLTLERLMISGNSWIIETALPESYALSERSSHDVETRLALLKSMQDHCVEFLDQAEAALDVGTEQMGEIAEEIFERTISVLMTMCEVLDSDNGAAAFNFGVSLKETSDEENEIQLHTDSLQFVALMLSQNLLWCADIMFLAHKNLVGEEAAAEMYSLGDDEHQITFADLSYYDLPVLHQGAFGLRVMLTNLMSQLRAGNKNHKRTTSLKKLTRSVELLTNSELPFFVTSHEKGTIFEAIWSDDVQTRHDWIEADLIICADLIFQLDNLKASGRAPARAEAALDLVLTCLQAWIGAAEKHQTEKTLAE